MIVLETIQPNRPLIFDGISLEIGSRHQRGILAITEHIADNNKKGFWFNAFVSLTDTVSSSNFSTN